jgi:hypothetical protein
MFAVVSSPPAAASSDVTLVAGQQSLFEMCWKGVESQEFRLQLKAAAKPWKTVAKTMLVQSARCPTGSFMAIYVFKAPPAGVYQSREVWARSRAMAAGRSTGPTFRVSQTSAVPAPPPSTTTTQPSQKLTWYCPDGAGQSVSVPANRPDLLERAKHACYERIRRQQEAGRAVNCPAHLPGMCTPGLAPQVP